MEKMIVNLQDIDISETAAFNHYQHYKEELDFELNNRNFIRTYVPAEIKQRNDSIKTAAEKLPPVVLKSKADELIKAQNLDTRYDDLINHMAAKGKTSYQQFSGLWSPVLWQSRETNTRPQVKINDKVVDAFDLDFIIAESLQHLYASEDPMAEYYDWCERQQKIEIDIYSGGTTEEEIVARNTFISFLDDRETELKRVIQLYSGAAFNTNSRLQESAQEKLKFLTFKLSELRRLRERTSSTKSQADEKQYFIEQERRQMQEAKFATAALAGIGAMSLAEKRLKEQTLSNTLEHGIGESFLHLRPETKTVEQAMDRIKTAKEHRAQMLSMFDAMRNGMSKEEWERLQQTNGTPVPYNPKSRIKTLRGWELSRYKEISLNV